MLNYITLRLFNVDEVKKPRGPHIKPQVTTNYV